MPKINFIARFKTIACAVAFALTSCASLKVTSQPPGAEVLLVAANNSQPKSLGRTPFDAAVSELASASGGGPVVIQIKQTGYQTQSFLVPTLGGEYAIEARLERNPFASFEDLNKIIKLSFLAERQILQKQYDEAIKTADRLILVNDNVAMAYQIKGTVYFIQSKFNESRVELQRVLELDPENPEIRTLLKAVEEKMGVKPTTAPAVSK
jgi:tetratricopeptide (TPR) repeat protein